MPALPTEKIYLSPRAYDYFGAEYGDISGYVARVHGRVLLEEKRLSAEVYELTLVGRASPSICNGAYSLTQGGRHVEKNGRRISDRAR